ncbi:bifunctional (p)ppGpp synthetase/guanosine-3',5'-bis(diphosphate) 3'-pyrophosphohydrolase [Caldimonas thermodepolymerans]|jgi:(p)ppGpp synthetase, RelA/SpoT family|uniref:GTP pyrophosphokinase n=1 Tax=Caldimonas thermodepolymerans TaxID=215580 RepID=A0A2S5T6F0_9BURK|nr:bifunctional (p)ppGpp synthetase/guanosine-3',5'-bis(diphosphate) 3'-pyrophosphohydrolase [Caldimonas thermodepolymerans]PPE70575.1 GTP pyrophosphokinase [Caldimonas thermodepolymerans]QPC30041.1 bifunctional (p)ppGpp synthetase/guanosine-3',5'-bis(diphosphate) 3'-pyrophosphohydrolase [Caldimonas thermodepolymerans]RDH97666.1 GTP pyrophosphokinase [Caldimonas thermodepolymerans]TCP10079.1 GTP pyrophosphokinase [Caldimonas thermodepolymerans]UZG42787.1 bifunctional (p)ppGpp synthetase/guanos
MKTDLQGSSRDTAAIVALAGDVGGQLTPRPSPEVLAEEQARLERARSFAIPLLTGQVLDTGEDALHHAEGVVAILQAIGASPSMLAAVYLVYVAEYLNRPEEAIGKAFGPSYASLVGATRKLVQIQRNARGALVAEDDRAEQIERVRKMLLAFSRDLRVVLLRLASRLQTLRYYAQSKRDCPQELARESLQVFAPLANRLGIWQIKWELEDLSFRFLEPEAYKSIARMLDEKRVEREQVVRSLREQVASLLKRRGIAAEVQGRPKHIYSIWKKMRGKQLDFDHVFDIRALRVVVRTVRDCYAALSVVHEAYTPLSEEFDDYIAKPKPNGYQSLHTVVYDAQGRTIEIQIRTREMHEHAEHGVAAHWAYKEAGTKGYGGVVAAGDFESQVAEARKAVLRQLLAWERDFAEQGSGSGVFDDHIYVFTPQASVVELPKDATPIDFAYSVHTDLGHRCRGAKVDGVMVPLNTPLRSGQTVEVITVKEGGPSMDWLNPELGYLKSSRAKAKVRAWFNMLAQQETIAKGRELVERLLQREGRTAINLEDLAAQLGFRNADALFDVVGKDEYSLRNIEQVLRPGGSAPQPSDDFIPLRKPRADAASARGGVLVVGVESLLTQLARCCKPAPPDAIGGFVTKGRGVAVHRSDCTNFRQLAARDPERVIPVEWGQPPADKPAVYPVDVAVEAHDRQGLLRDISEVFAKEKMNVIGVRTQSVRDTAWMTFTVEVSDSARLAQVLGVVRQVPGVRIARRK